MAAGRPLRSIIVCSAAGLILAACAGDDDGEPAAATATVEAEAAVTQSEDEEPIGSDTEVPDGWELVEGDGYQISLPPGWFNAGRVSDYEDFLDELGDGLDHMVEDDNLRSLIEDGIRNDAVDLFAIRTEDLTGEFVSNINIIVQERGPLDEPEAVLDLAPDIVASFGADLTHADMNSTGGLPTVEVTYDLPLQTGVVGGVQGYLFADDVVYIATYTAPEPDLELWSSMLATFTPET